MVRVIGLQTRTLMLGAYNLLLPPLILSVHWLSLILLCKHWLPGARDVVQSVKELSSVKATLQDVRNNISAYRSQLYEEMLTSIGEEPGLPRRCGCQCHRSNVPAESTTAAAYPFLFLPFRNGVTFQLTSVNCTVGSVHRTIHSHISSYRKVHDEKYAASQNVEWWHTSSWVCWLHC